MSPVFSEKLSPHVTQNMGIASYKRNLQKVEDTSNSLEERRYELSQALSEKTGVVHIVRKEV